MWLILYLSDAYLLGMAAWLAVLAISFMGCVRLSRRWKPQPKKMRLLQWGLSLWSVLAILTGIELFYALFYDRSDSFNMTNISQRWYARHVFRNPQGYRDDHPFLPQPAEGKKRIVFLGDSFTFGHGIPNVTDRFSDRVGQALERAHPHEYEVANLGSPGLGVPEASIILKNDIVAKECRVDILVYVICLNDIESFHQDKSLHDEQRGSLRPEFFSSATRTFSISSISASSS